MSRAAPAAQSTDFLPTLQQRQLAAHFASVDFDAQISRVDSMLANSALVACFCGDAPGSVLEVVDDLHRVSAESGRLVLETSVYDLNADRVCTVYLVVERDGDDLTVRAKGAPRRFRTLALATFRDLACERFERWERG